MVSAIVAVLVLAAAFLVYFLSRSTIAFTQKCGGGQCWGYQVDQYQVSRRTRLTIFGSWGLHLQYELPKMIVERANEDRWLANDRAIYMNLRLKPLDDLGALGTHVQILYDYQRGEIYITSPLQLWRAPDYRSGDLGRNWMSETDFDAAVRRIEP